MVCRLISMGLLLCVVVVGITACSSESAITQQEEANKALIVRLHEEFGKGNFEILDEALTQNFVRHCQAMPPELQEIRGAEKLKVFVEAFFSACPDNEDTIDLMVAEGDKVAYIVTMRGTQTGEMDGLPAKGKNYTLVNIIVARFEDGKVAETWVSWDNVAMLTQMGHFPPPVPEQP